MVSVRRRLSDPSTTCLMWSGRLFKAVGGDDHAFAEGGKCFADDLFIHVRAVDLGSVEERDATLDRCADELNRLRFFRCGAKAEAQAHASETKCRYLKTAVA
jgi:hypothetical protein